MNMVDYEALKKSIREWAERTMEISIDMCRLFPEIQSKIVCQADLVHEIAQYIMKRIQEMETHDGFDAGPRN